MMEVGLSYAQSKKYLSGLVQEKLLEIDEKHGFKTTSKGLEFLEKCEQCSLFKWDRHKKLTAA